VKSATETILQAEQATYLDALLPPRDALFQRMEAYARERQYPISDPEVAAFLAVTARAMGATFLVEVGTNIGYGAIALARGAGPQAKVLTIELSAELCRTARDFIAEAGLSSQIEVRQGAALQELATIDRPIDLVYIDCVKEEYTRYLELIVPRLAPRGVIVADNALWMGLVARGPVPEVERERTEGIRAFNLALVQHPSLQALVLPLGDGVAYAVKRD